ncbi:DUF3284 domain-containing protein [Schleiferilactobacillus perolens]|uniref:DUF3284 domain-containing protein n=1 Tax=Schleiferilactobacillus perolens TaxID=100468 RepID=UPI002352DCF5|nr:DUF3284 domain-containing protein [Schleiferilactobacillus perolens]MCI2170044.1 DUF3284 domain-containing protein [Schleiferilactobacillus perolens]
MKQVSTKYKMKATPQRVYAVILAEQLRYFQFYDATVTELQQGTTIQTQLRTKTSRKLVPATMTITQLAQNAAFSSAVAYHGGAIAQTFALTACADGQTEVTYTEQNEFDDKRGDLNFDTVSLLYRFFYKRAVTKRLKKLAEIVENDSGDLQTGVARHA